MEQRSQSHSICAKMVMSGFQSKRAITHHGRGLGKSVWTQMVQDLTLPNVTLVASAEVDGKIWHTVQLSYPVAEWVRQQDSSLWVEPVAQQSWKKNYFDIEESLFTMLKLKWS